MSSRNPARRRGPGLITPNACTECRKKRAKCNGKLPCGRCIFHNIQDECVYQAPLRQTKEEARVEIESLRRYQSQSTQVFKAMTSDDNNSADIVNKLRNGEDLAGILKGLEHTASSSTLRVPPHQSFQTAGGRMSDVAGPSRTLNPALHPFASRDWPRDSTIESRIQSAREYGQQFILGDTTDSQEFLAHHGPTHKNESWTAVTSDVALVEHLLALYFCWEYPIFATISREDFMEDFREGNPRLCSPILVNALLALACRFSDNPTTRSDPEDRTTAGDDFFAEAQRLLHAEIDHHVLTTIHALGLMSIRQASCGRIAESNHLSAQSIRLVVEMGLHVGPVMDDDDEDEVLVHVCETTFWGALSLDEMLSLCVGSLPHLSKNIHFPPKPPIIQHLEESLWIPYTDDGAPLEQHFYQPSNLRTVHNTFCELSEKVHHALCTLYDPESSVNSQKLISLYNQYIQWFDTVPDSVRLGHNFTPQVLFAHLFYHATTLLLFQPFLNLKLTNSSVVPREVCYQAADAITRLVRSYSDLYTLRRTPSFTPFFVLTAAIIHLLALKDDPSSETTKLNLTKSIADLGVMAECHGFAVRAMDSLKYLSRQWDVSVEEFAAEEGEEGNDGFYRPSSVLLDHFSPDISIMQTLQSLQPVLSATDTPLFAPFPMQGLPSMADAGPAMEKQGFLLVDKVVMEGSKGKMREP